jgi:hypothetical protein
MWFLLQSAIITAVVQSNITWHWAERTSHAVMIGVGLAWLATVVAEGHQEQLRRSSIMKTQMKQPLRNGHLGTAIFWIGLLALCSQGAAQIPRPPMPIPGVVAPAPPPRPSAPKVANLMPATIPLTRSSPTPIPPAATTEPVIPIPPHLRLVPEPIPVTMPVAPLNVMMPPPEFDHEYKGKLNVLREPNYAFIKYVCSDVANPIACSFRTYDSVSGETISCLIMLGPNEWEDERVLRHEMAHCLGWPGDHPGAR